MTLAVYWLYVAVLLSCNVLIQSEITTLYPTDPQDWSLFPYGAGDVELPDRDDESWEINGLTQNVIFFGTSYDEIHVNTNGYISFGTKLVDFEAMIEDPFPSRGRVPLIAPFNAEVDFGGYEPGFLSYRVDTTPDILSRATDAVMAISVYAQELPDFQATLTVIVTWHEAGYFRAIPNDLQVSNTFQLVLACDDAHTFAIYNYGHEMGWGSVGRTQPSAGVDAGDDSSGYMFPRSQSDALRDIVRNKRVTLRVDTHVLVLPMCLPGTMSTTGSELFESCSECLIGFYQHYAGGENCFPCPSGQTTLNTGSDNSADCFSPGSSVLDPHFMITNPKTGERFCFDYGGKERDVLNLVHDDKAELSIYGILFEVGRTEEKVTYFANIIIGTSAGTLLNFTKYEITVGDEELSWDMEDIHVGDDVVIRPLDERAQAMLVELDGGDIGVVVTRHHDDIGYYLGVYLSNTEGLSSDSEGLLGQFIHNDFEVDVPNSLVTWHLSRGDIVVPVVQKERFNPAAHDNQMCWVYLTEDEDNELFTATMTHTSTHARNAFIG